MVEPKNNLVVIEEAVDDDLDFGNLVKKVVKMGTEEDINEEDQLFADEDEVVVD